MKSVFEEAFLAALERREPQFVPLRHFADDRGWSLMNLFSGVLNGGQCNYSVTHPGVRKAWHRHARQTDFWIVTNGMAKLGVFDEEREKASGYAGQTYFLGEKNPGALVIPPPLWHGLTCVGDEACGLLYYVTHVYDSADPDEQRLPYYAFPAYNWDVEHK